MAILDDTRADWNARPPLRPLTRVPWSERVGCSWHWIGPGKGPSAAGPHSACLDQVREWQRQHQAKNWKDIGYPALICQHARAIEGRGLDTEGSHSPGVNWEHVGIQFMVGTDTPGGVSAAMYARAVRLRADIGELGKNIHRDWGHRDDPEASTSCPGDGIHAWVHSGGPTTAPTTTTEDEDMPTLDEIAKAVWDHPVPRPGNTPSAAGNQLGNANVNSYRAARGTSSLEATVAAQAAALALLANGSAVDVEQIKAAIAEAVSNFELTLAPKKDDGGAA